MKMSDKCEKVVSKTFNSLEKARFWEVVMDYGMLKGTDISIYITISNILTLHYIQYILSTSLSLYLIKIKYVCFSKKPDFLLCLVSIHTEKIQAFLKHNIENFEEIIAEIHENEIKTDISTKTAILALFFEVTNIQFWLRKCRNLLQSRIADNPSNYSKTLENKKIQVTQHMQLGYALFWLSNHSYFNKKMS